MSDTPWTDECISRHIEYAGYGRDRVSVECEHVEVFDCRGIERELRSEIANKDARIAELEAERDALRAALASSETVRVPREPTEAMMKAGDEAIIDGMQKAQLGISYGLHPEHACWNVYRSMLAAHEKEPKP